jgi:hypothetical protein
MATFFVETPHTAEECSQALSDIKSQGDLLEKTYLGCHSGNHVGYAFLEGDNERDVLQKLPDAIRNKARAIAVEQFSREQIRSMHRPVTA